MVIQTFFHIACINCIYMKHTNFFIFLFTTCTYSRVCKKIIQCISNSSSICYHEHYKAKKQIKETLPLSDEGSGFLRSSSSNKASSSTNSTSSSNMSDADKVHTLATSSCDLSTERNEQTKLTMVQLESY